MCSASAAHLVFHSGHCRPQQVVGSQTSVFGLKSLGDVRKFLKKSLKITFCISQYRFPRQHLLISLWMSQPQLELMSHTDFSTLIPHCSTISQPFLLSLLLRKSLKLTSFMRHRLCSPRKYSLHIYSLTPLDQIRNCSSVRQWTWSLLSLCSRC